MSSTEVCGAAQEALKRVRSAIALLSQPTIEAIERCTSEVAAAAEYMRYVNARLEPGDGAVKRSPALLAAVEEIWRGVGRMDLLMRHAFEFEVGRAVAGLDLPAGYTPAGSSSVELPSCRWALEG